MLSSSEVPCPLVGLTTCPQGLQISFPRWLQDLQQRVALALSFWEVVGNEQWICKQKTYYVTSSITKSKLAIRQASRSRWGI